MVLLGISGTDPTLPAVGGIVVEVDWMKDGWGQFIDDVTNYVKRSEQVSVQYGRDQTTALSPSVAGTGGFVLKNDTRRFSPRNTSSALYGKLKPARPVRITRTIGDVVYGLFNGHADDTPLSPDRNSQSLSMSLLDHLADFRGQTISTQLHRDIRTGEAIGLVLDACGWPEDKRDLDVGYTIIPWWWEDGTDAMEAMEKIVRSEGPPALLSVGGNGEIVFRDRHHRLARVPSLFPQGPTWQAVMPLEPVMLRDGYAYDEAPRNIINSGSVSIDVRQPGEETAVWTSDTTITLGAGEQRILSVVASEPFYNALTPVAGTDYVLDSGAVTVRLITTSGLSTGIELTAGVAGAVLSALQLRANPLTVAYTVQISASDAESIEEHGRKSFPTDLPWCSPEDAQAVLDVAVAMRSQPLPIVSCKFLIGTNAKVANALLIRDLSDRVTAVDPETGELADYYIESIGHEFTSDYDHAILFGLEAAPTAPDNIARFDTPGVGFDLGIFSTGMDDPNTMARFDTAGLGFNQGRFSH